MNTLTLIALLLAATATNNMVGGSATEGKGGHAKDAAADDAAHEEQEKVLIQCSEENGATDDDINEFYDYKLYQQQPIDTQVLKCVAGCFFLSRDFLVDGTFDKETFKKILTDIIGEKRATAGAEYCEPKLANASGDICELGDAYYACVLDVFTDNV